MTSIDRNGITLLWISFDLKNAVIYSFQSARSQQLTEFAMRSSALIANCFK
jgi:hypothetical protein